MVGTSRVGWGGGNNVHIDFKHGKLIEDFGHSKLQRTPPAPLVTVIVLLTCAGTCIIRLERLKMPNDINLYGHSDFRGETQQAPKETLCTPLQP